MENLNLPNEIWKPINDFNGKYEISNLGRVKSNKYRGGYSIKIMTPKICRKGYHRITLTQNNIPKSFAIHRLVGEHFIENIFNKEQINHINAIKSDNRVENLEWCTNYENMIHAKNMGLRKISDYQRMIMSEIAKNNKFGKNPTSKKVIDEQTGNIYESASFLATIINIKYGTILSYLTPNNGRKNPTTFRYI